MEFKLKTKSIIALLDSRVGVTLSNTDYIIAQVILAFWFVLAYDLLEDRRMIDVITTKFFPLCFKMEENFENLDNILRD